MREISPAIGMSTEEYIQLLVPKSLHGYIAEIRRQKAAGGRVRPSSTLIDRSAILTADIRANLLDKIAELTDENLAGRSDMCFQFANLLNRALTKLGFPSRPAMGTAIYFDKQGSEVHRWDHAWVRVDDEVIDGNVDSISENPMVPSGLQIAPYWGPIRETPADRKLQEHWGIPLPKDDDVDNIWWPDLDKFLDSTRST
jgi:hypothetical protein